jgi:hypothetical protein
MRVRLNTIEVSDEFRRKLNKYVGGKGLASRAAVKSHAHAAIDQYFVDVDDDIDLEENDDA